MSSTRRKRRRKRRRRQRGGCANCGGVAGTNKTSLGYTPLGGGRRRSRRRRRRRRRSRRRRGGKGCFTFSKCPACRSAGLTKVGNGMLRCLSCGKEFKRGGDQC